MGLRAFDGDATGFKAALGSVAATVHVITMRDELGAPWGMTATAFSSVSLEPLRVLVCLNRTTRSYAHVRRQGGFGVNVLGAHAQEISEYCARPAEDKRLAARWLDTDPRWAAPALSGALAFLDCAVHEEITSGTHAVLIGAVHGIGLPETGPSEPLVYFRGAYRQLQALVQRRRPRPLPVAWGDYS